MDTSTPFKLSICVSFYLVNDASISYYGFIGENEWDCCCQNGRLDDEDRILIDRMLDRYEAEIRRRAGRVTVEQIAKTTSIDIELLTVTRKRPYEIHMYAALNVIEED